MYSPMYVLLYRVKHIEDRNRSFKMTTGVYFILTIVMTCCSQDISYETAVKEMVIYFQHVLGILKLYLHFSY